jgi:hypothetical protein
MAEKIPGVGVVEDVAKLVTGGASGAVTDALNTMSGGLDSVSKAFQDNVTKVEDWRISLTRASGAGSTFIDQIRKEAYEANEYGVKLGKLVEVNVEVAKSISKAVFTSAQRRQDFEKDRKEIVELIAVNEKFGATSGQTTDLINKLGNAFGGDNGLNFNVTKFSDSLLKFSRETGQPFTRVLQEFSTYNDRFLQSVDKTPGSLQKATQGFANLELIAKRTNSSVSQLVGSISKFDDIDQAFSSGGQINRVLSYFGGSFDTLAAANASDEERAKMLMESISSIGDKFQQQMTNPQARRSILKELESATGLNTETLTGLLNKQTDLSKDINAIMRTPVPISATAGLAPEEKKKMAMDLTTMGEVTEIAKEQAFIGPITTAMERFSANHKAIAVETGKKVGETLDVSFKEIINNGNVKGALDNIKTAVTNFQTSLSQTPSAQELLQGALGQMKSTPGDAQQKSLDATVNNLMAKDKIAQEALHNKIAETTAAKVEAGVAKGVEKGVAAANVLPKQQSEIKITLLSSDGKPIQHVIARV